ncbi:hypothetical protein BOTBODRAFT_41597 [Botryobasidium botryosum FD-172 SS1]|uniref:Uncharacterized protein n=1 Tax=Botryobasidium botryosum (strain FD-172 SS1) TaxID=930990 RepID=A0A067N5H7_BOTB1|nr:hypothetical protein BOTBODRAFT_41597 [Botryobasidium botryosum FD-172 SS1]
MGKPVTTAPKSDSLTVRDERTGKTYSIPITDNTIPATAFKAIKAPRREGEREENETERGLRGELISDRGFLNTAVIQPSSPHLVHGIAQAPRRLEGGGGADGAVAGLACCRNRAAWDRLAL